MKLPTDEEVKKLPKLDYRPALLQTWALYAVLCIDLLVLGILIALLIKKSFTIEYAWGYFVIQVLPIVIGTLTITLLDGGVEAFSRITPFMLSANDRGATADKTILAGYMPILGFRDSFRIRNWPLLWCNILSFLANFTILGFKAALLTTEDYEYAEATPYAIRSLLGIYGLLAIHYVGLLWYFHGRLTGLRWDPVSIADHLVLFRHSDFLDRFDGAWIGSMENVRRELGGMILRLGYWSRGGVLWHGFGLVHQDGFTEKVNEEDPPQSNPAQEYITRRDLSTDTYPDRLPESVDLTGGNSAANGETSSREDERDNGRGGEGNDIKKTASSDGAVPLDDKTLSELRYSGGLNYMDQTPLWGLIALTLALLVSCIVVLALGAPRGYIFPALFSTNLTSFLFQFIPTNVVAYYTVVWQNIAYWSALTEPFAALEVNEAEADNSGGHNDTEHSTGAKSPESPQHESQTAKQRSNAHDTLLLNYTCLPATAAIYSAFVRKHWKVARTTIFSLLQRALPIIVGSSVTIIDDPGVAYYQVKISRSSFVVITVWLGVYLVLIPYEILECGYNRNLPRNFTTIGDLLSWTWGSRLLRDGNFGGQAIGGEENGPNSNNENSNNPLDFPVQSEESEQWNMEARLRLLKKRFRFGLSKISSTRPGSSEGYTVGICESSDLVDVLRPTVPWPVRLWKKSKGPNPAGAEGGPYRISGAMKFGVIPSGDKFDISANAAHPTVAVEHEVVQPEQ